MKWVMFVFVLVVGLSGVSAADGTTALYPPEVRQSLLDAEKKVLDAERQLVDEKMRHQRSEHEVFLKNENTLFRYTTAGLVGGILIGWLSFVLLTKGWVRSQVDKEIHGNLRHLSQVVDNSRLETRLKSERRLLVLFGEGGSSGLDTILRNFGFDSVEAIPCPSVPDELDWGEYDQVIFDNIDEVLLRAYVAFDGGRWYMLYKEGKPYDRDFVGASKLTLANNKITLYPRLMELLSWKHMQEPKS